MKYSTKKIKIFNVKNNNTQVIIAVLVVVVLATLGYLILSGSRAQGPYASANATGGVVVSPASSIAGTSGASGHNVVQFGPAPGSGGGMEPTVPAGTTVPTTLKWNDEFNGTSLDTTKWTPTWTSADGGTSNNSVMHESNVSVSGGVLHLKTGNGDGSIVNTNPSYGPQPGLMLQPTASKPIFVEYRASIPGSGTQNYNWPALWLSAPNWPGNGEIDAYEGFGDTTSHLEYGTCTGSNGCGSAPAFNNPGTGNVGGPTRAWTSGFHTWGVLWYPTAVTVFYDGQVESTYNNSTLAGTVYAQLSTSPPDSVIGPMEIIMENAFANNAQSNTDMQVDYVRVWQ